MNYGLKCRLWLHCRFYRARFWWLQLARRSLLASCHLHLSDRAAPYLSSNHLLKCSRLGSVASWQSGPSLVASAPRCGWLFAARNYFHSSGQTARHGTSEKPGLLPRAVLAQVRLALMLEDPPDGTVRTPIVRPSRSAFREVRVFLSGTIPHLCSSLSQRFPLLSFHVCGGSALQSFAASTFCWCCWRTGYAHGWGC